ncbi:MAG: glycosyltransferase family 4 protein [Anaerolineae bacterium]
MRIGIDYTAAVRQRAGIGRLTRGLIGALPALDAENEYRLFVAGRGVQRSGPQAPNVRTVWVPLTDRETAFLWQRLSAPLPIEAWLGRLDLFHSPDFVLPVTWARRKVLTVHDLTFLRVPECAHPVLRGYLARVVPRSVARADLVVVDSASTGRDVVELLGYPAERVRVVYPGVEPCFRPITDEAERARVCGRYGLTRPYILGVSTLEPRKNFAGLVAAFARLRERRCLPHMLAIAGGKGWLYEPIFAQVRESGVEEHVLFLGHVADADLPALYSAAECFAYPSFYEGFGIPVVEAMACGTPVVASQASSVPEAAGDAAILIDPHNIESMADALERVLYDQPLRARLRSAGMEQARRFTWADAGRALLAAYRSL